MLDLTDLRDRAGDQVGTLSGGNRQRVNIAIGLLAEPDVLLLDEPSAALDPRQRARLWEFILRLAGEGTTVIYATHNVQEADRYANQLIVLADGERLFDGSPRDARAARSARRASTSRRPSSSSCTSAATEMRWLLLKDLRSCAARRCWWRCSCSTRSMIAVLIGFALSRGPDKPEVAFYNGLEGKSAVVELGGDRIDLAKEGRGCSTPSTRCAWTARQEAIQKVKDGDVLGALIIPERPRRRTSSRRSSRGRSRSTTTPRTRPSASSSRTRSRRRCRRPTARSRSASPRRRCSCSTLISKGGDYSFLGQNFNVLGLKRAETILAKARRRAPARLGRARRSSTG